MKTRKTRYAHYNINSHFVWIPKYRRKVLTGAVADELERLIRKVCGEILTEGDDISLVSVQI
ncbi:MAG: transposase [Hydrogenibacillus schlegelii]|uniref:Transposase n=1 Tax=Hydrogenibacillus schlegelii TaxID=1484 RepID=A0A947D1Z2_HYDSH|nr:transposase [Hydrogenibacillus schlegelii]